MSHKAVLPHHQRIAEEYAQGEKDARRERRRMAVWALALCWLWVIVACGLIGYSAHINATVGPFYYPRMMAKAQAFYMAGLFVGISGPLVTLGVAWWRAMQRGILE